MHGIEVSPTLLAVSSCRPGRRKYNWLYNLSVYQVNDRSRGVQTAMAS